MLNVSGYRFFLIPEFTLPTLKKNLRDKAEALRLKGTILLSSEGINVSLSGKPECVLEFKSVLDKIPGEEAFCYQESFSKAWPFKRLLVKVKRQIIPGFPLNARDFLIPYLSPETLHTWLSEQRDLVLLDVRNKYEVAFGTFEAAVHGDLQYFRDFEKAINKFCTLGKNRTVVTFCTGGIRCEKASIMLKKQDFKQVYQLQGGLLNYFHRCGGAYYQGLCFVFDDRIALDPALCPLNEVPSMGFRI